MPSVEIIIRVITFLLLFSRIPYWLFTRRQADKIKPKKQASTHQGKLSRYALYLAWTFLFIQLAGLQLFSYPSNQLLQVIGLLLTITGVTISILGRHNLGMNWTHSGESQIKQNHELVSSGIYGYIRHPIYSGVAISYVGGELVAQSYLVIFLQCFLLLQHTIKPNLRRTCCLSILAKNMKTIWRKQKCLFLM